LGFDEKRNRVNSECILQEQVRMLMQDFCILNLLHFMPL
jgi:hypothetical protein